MELMTIRYYPSSSKPRKRDASDEVSELSDNAWGDLGKFYYDRIQGTLLLGWELRAESTEQGGSVN